MKKTLRQIFAAAALSLSAFHTAGYAQTSHDPIDIPTPRDITITEIEQNTGRDFPEFEYFLYPEFNSHAITENHAAHDLINDLSTCQISEAQHYLITLGFDLGPSGADGVAGRLTYEAIRMYQFYWGDLHGLEQTGVLDQATLTDLEKTAKDIKVLAKHYRAPAKAIAAIAFAHEKLNSDFGYQMELAYVESSFRSHAKARRSSAYGLYQYTTDTWLLGLSQFGHKYDLGFYSDQIKFREQKIPDSDKTKLKPYVSNPIAFQNIMNLRKDPYLSALITVEFSQTHDKATASWDVYQEGNHRADKYLVHFFGMKDSLLFAHELKQRPTRKAADVFPKLAEANPRIFYHKRKARSFAEIYSHLQGKFNRDRFEPANDDKTLAQKAKSIKEFGCRKR